MADNNGWDEYRKLVEYRFDRLDASVIELNHEISALREGLHNIRLKIAGIGGAFGLLGWLVPQFIQYLTKG